MALRVDIRIGHGSADALADYASIPIAFEVRERLLVEDARRATEAVEPSWIKDYDALEAPSSWAERFDVTRWAIVSAWHGTTRLGGVIVIHGARDVALLGGRPDIALLWDIRVAPMHRGHGVGQALLSAAEEWATARGAKWMEVETQDINVPACRFYERQGFALIRIDRDAYPALPDEIQLLWRKRLRQGEDVAK